MKTLVRILAIVVGAVALVFVSLAAYLALIFDPNDYRDQLAAQVREQTGRELVISGDLGVSVFPWIGIELGALNLGNAPGFGDEPFASVTRAEARARLMPMLRGEVEVDRVVLKGLVLNLERDAQGRGNWEGLLPEQDAEDGREGERVEGAGAGQGVAALAIGGLEVESAQLSWHDRTSGVRHRISNLAINSGRIAAGAAFPLKVGFDVSSTEPAVEGRLEVDASLLADPARARYAVEAFEAHFVGRGDALPGGSADLRLRTKLDLDLAEGRLVLSGLTLSGWGLDVQGDLEGRALLAEPAFQGRVQVAEFSPRALLEALGQPVPDTADAAVLARASLGATVQAAADRIMLESIELRLDDTTVKGTAGLAAVGKRAISADLQVDTLNLDRYLPPRAPAAAPVAATPGAAAAAAADLSGLKALNLAGKLTIGELIASGLKIANVAVTARAADGLLRLQPIAAELYQGRYGGNVAIDARGQALRISADESLSGIQIGPLLRDLTGKEAVLTGQAQVAAKLQASGNDADALKRSLGGNGQFRLTDGAVKGVNVAQFLREAGARLRNQPVPPQTGPNQTDFSELGGTLQIANGVVRNDDLAAKSPLLRVAGSGSADLGSERLDYRIRATLVGSLEGQGGQERDALRGVTVPVRITGTFAQPAYALDVETLIAENVKQQARERIEQKLIEQLGGRQPGGAEAGADQPAAETPQDALRRGLRGLLR